jgi:hypothetical protein
MFGSFVSLSCYLLLSVKRVRVSLAIHFLRGSQSGCAYQNHCGREVRLLWDQTLFWSQASEIKIAAFLKLSADLSWAFEVI